ncbi:hypothetical protein [Zobellia uliginosa]|nr:hypothetical protein [Zobellia uliginosa]
MNGRNTIHIFLKEKLETEIDYRWHTDSHITVRFM